jgi:uncharacterized protein YceK
MRRLALGVLAALLLAGCLAVVPAQAQAAPGHARAYDPLVGNWYRGKMWFKVNAPSNHRYRVTWSNGSGAKLHYTIKRRADGVYYEVANHKNTYRMVNSYTVAVRYRTTDGRYISRRFARVG